MLEWFLSLLSPEGGIAGLIIGIVVPLIQGYLAKAGNAEAMRELGAKDAVIAGMQAAEEQERVAREARDRVEREPTTLVEEPITDEFRRD